MSAEIRPDGHKVPEVRAEIAAAIQPGIAAIQLDAAAPEAVQLEMADDSFTSTSTASTQPAPPPPKAWEKAIGARVELVMLPGIGSGKAMREYDEARKKEEAAATSKDSLNVKIVSSK